MKEPYFIAHILYIFGKKRKKHTYQRELITKFPNFFQKSQEKGLLLSPTVLIPNKNSGGAGLKGLKARTQPTASQSLPIAGAVYRRAIKILSKNERRGRAMRRKKKGIGGRRGILKAIRRCTSLCSRWHAGFLYVAIVVVDDDVMLLSDPSRIPGETALFSSFVLALARYFTLDTDQPAITYRKLESDYYIKWQRVGDVCIEWIMKHDTNHL